MTTLETGAREDPEADLASCFAAGRTHPAEASPDLLAQVLELNLGVVQQLRLSLICVAVFQDVCGEVFPE